MTTRDYYDYINADSKNYGDCICPHSLKGILVYINYHLRYMNPISDQSRIWAYIKTLRKVELLMSNKSLFSFRRVYYLHKLRKLARETGFQIPPYTFGKGLTIWHWGTIIVNPKARIGQNCTIQPQVVIGWNEQTKEAPVIGDNVTIFGGSFIYGGIKVGNNVTIACNSFVNKDVPDNCMVAGNPAVIIKRI